MGAGSYGTMGAHGLFVGPNNCSVVHDSVATVRKRVYSAAVRVVPAAMSDFSDF